MYNHWKDASRYFGGMYNPQKGYVECKELKKEEKIMTDAIEKMKEEGWEIENESDFFKTVKMYGDCDVLLFTRPKQKPNAIVDFEALEKLKSVWTCGAVEEVEKLIKKSND